MRARSNKRGVFPRGGSIGDHSRGRAAMASGDIRIGISGWTYGRWRGVFYPEKLPRKHELGFAARCFPSIEINGTFYRLLQPDSRSEEHTSELQSLMRISYAVFCLKKKKQ